jgi:hypothetical protein
MKKKIKDKIMAFIGEDIEIPKCEDCPFCDRGLYRKCNAYEVDKEVNQALADLRSKADTLVDEICGVVEKEVEELTGEMKTSETERIINHLKN